MRMLVRRKPKEIEVERWDGPGDYIVPPGHVLGGKHMTIQLGYWIAKNGDDDWYPLNPSVLERDFEMVRILD